MGLSMVLLQGMCSGSAASFAPAAILDSGVCAIAVEEGFLHLPSSSEPNGFWLDKLYISLSGSPTDDQGDTGTLVLHEAGSLFMTNVTFDGRDRHARAMYLSKSDALQPSELHAEGVPSP